MAHFQRLGVHFLGPPCADHMMTCCCCVVVQERANNTDFGLGGSVCTQPLPAYPPFFPLLPLPFFCFATEKIRQLGLFKGPLNGRVCMGV